MIPGKTLRDFLHQVHLSMSQAAFLLDGVNVRTVRNWCSAPSARCASVPAWVIPRLETIIGQAPHPAVDKFVFGTGIGPHATDRTYLVHTQAPRFSCVVSPADKNLATGEGPAFACGNRMFHHFIFMDTPLDGIQAVLDQASGIMDQERIAIYTT